MDHEMTLLKPVLQSGPPDYNIFGTNEHNVEARLKVLPKGTLVDNDKLTRIESSHFDSTTQAFTAFSVHHDISSIATWLRRTNDAKIRFLSIPQQLSITPLQITRSGLQHILVDLEVDLAFLDVIAAFGDKPRISEAGYDCFHTSETHNKSSAWLYLHRFVDRNNEASEYRIRQTGLYHKYDKVNKSHTFLFLQPLEDSVFDARLRLACSNAISAAEIVADPYKVHQILLETYFNNWRSYMKQVADDFQPYSDKVFTVDIHKATSGVTYDVLQSLRDLADRSLPLTAYFAAEQRIRAGLGALPSTSTIQAISRQHDSLSALELSTKVLLQRIDNVISLLSNTIDIRNQQDSAALNTHLYSLTKDTVDDSASVRIITFMSLLYLPASFVGTFFGMDFFNYDPVGHSLDTTPEFWIYVVTVVPLTIVTVACAWFWKRTSDRRRRKRKAGFVPTLEVR